MMLIIDCCVRGEASATRRYYRAWLDSLPEKPETELIDVPALGLQPFDAALLEKRDRLIGAGRFDDPMFGLARRVRNADELLIAAPYWDLSFPSALKVFFEHVCVSGLTFGYTEQGPAGFCRAKKLRYFSTCGGFTGGVHLGFEYVRAVAGLLGIGDCEAFTAEGLDIDPTRREEALAAAIRELGK